MFDCTRHVHRIFFLIKQSHSKHDWSNLEKKKCPSLSVMEEFARQRWLIGKKLTDDFKREAELMGKMQEWVRNGASYHKLSGCWADWKSSYSCTLHTNRETDRERETIYKCVHLWINWSKMKLNLKYKCLAWEHVNAFYYKLLHILVPFDWRT